MSNKIPFDFAAWRGRMGWTKQQAQEALGVSRAHYWKMEKEGAGSVMAAWATYGLETYHALKAAEELCRE